MAETLRTGFNSLRRWKYSLLAALTVSSMTFTPTLCAPTMKGIFTKLMDILYDIFFWMGAVIVAVSIANWVMAMKDENADGQSRAVRFIVVGIVLVCLESVLDPIIKLF